MPIEQIETKLTHSITSFGRGGDLTITWDKENEAEAIAYIEAQMKKGYTFLLVESDLVTITKDIGKIREAGQVRMSDEPVMPPTKTGDKLVDKIVESGKAFFVRAKDKGKRTLGAPIRDAATVARTNTVAVAPIQGG